MQDGASAVQLDSILGKNGFGSSVLEELRQVPCYAVRMDIVENDHAKPFIKVEAVVLVCLRLIRPPCARHDAASTRMRVPSQDVQCNAACIGSS